MIYLPIDKTQFTITPFYTYKHTELTQNNSGVNFYSVSSISTGTSSCIYGTIKNMYGTGAETVFNQKNLTIPKDIRVIGISNLYYGEEIVPASFSIKDNYHSPTILNIVDDGYGNLWDYDIKGTESGGYFALEGSGSRNALTGSCCNVNFGYDDFMVEVYLTAHQNYTSSGIISRRDGNIGFEIHALGNTTASTFFIGDSAGNTVFNQDMEQPVFDGSPHHLAMYFDRDGNAVLYIDNSTGSVTGIDISSVSASISNSANLSIGARYDLEPDRTLSGSIHTVRLYNFGSGGLPLSSISEYISYNYNSSSIHPELQNYLIEQWDWKSGSSTTGSIGGNYLNPIGKPHYRSSQVIGNIFYTNGIIVFTETKNPPYREIGSGSAGHGCKIYLKSTVKHNEMRIECSSPAGEQNASTNPTAIWSGSEIPIGSGAYEYKVVPHTPYITQVGLYNDNYELLAIGTLAKPIQKEKDMDMTFVVKIDL